MESFTIDSIKLFGHYDTDTGKVRTASIYWVDGIDRALTLAELVMAICLSRAAEKENTIIGIMRDMQDTNIGIQGITQTENLLFNFQTGGINSNKFKDLTSDTTKWPDELQEQIAKNPSLKDTLNYLEWLDSKGVTLPKDVSTTTGSLSKEQVQQLMTNIESRLDSLNSLSQQKMIELQSESNKRNQAFDLISSMVKSISTANQSIGANYR